MNTHAQALGRLGGLANKGKPKSEAHKAALRKVLDRSRIAHDASKPTAGYVDVTALTKLPEPKPEPKTCQASWCKNEGREVLVQGMKGWLCEEHG